MSIIVDRVFTFEKLEARFPERFCPVHGDIGISQDIPGAFIAFQ